MFARVYSGGVAGLDAFRIDVEVDCCGGIGQFSIVGLPDTSVKESQDRVRSAIKSCSLMLPPAKKWVINLAPADTRKEGPSYDLPIAIAVLASSSYLPVNNLSKLWFIGELGLDGAVRAVSGVLPIAMHARRAGAVGIVVPDANAEEASLVSGLKVYPVSHLRQAQLIVENLENGAVAFGPSNFSDLQRQPPGRLDYSEVKGQHSAKRALEIAAAGRHNLLMVGPPGAGKSMLAERLPSIMPPLTFEEAIELTKLYSVAGLLDASKALIHERPFRAPHHSASIAGIVGGGKRPKPGEISLSHLGVLFLDELTEFSKALLDNLRQPLESARVTICRANQSLTYPASFLFVGACNPCPCGYRGDQVKICICTPGQADRYWSRLSGPLLDRIDLQVSVSRLSESELCGDQKEEGSEIMRRRVNKAVRRQMERNIIRDPASRRGNSVSDLEELHSFEYNGSLTQSRLAKVCAVSSSTREFLASAVTRAGLSARAYDRTLRLARTIADLADSEQIEHVHLAEALKYRTPVVSFAH